MGVALASSFSTALKSRLISRWRFGTGAVMGVPGALGGPFAARNASCACSSRAACHSWANFEGRSWPLEGPAVAWVYAAAD